MTELEYLRELTRLQQRRIEQLEAELTGQLDTEVLPRPATLPKVDLTPPPSYPDPRTYPRWQC